MRAENDSFRIIEDALSAAGTPEADVVFISTDQNISRFANSNLHPNISEISSDPTLLAIALRGRGSGYVTAIRRGLVDMSALGEEATLKDTLAEDRIEDLERGLFDVILEPPATAEVIEWLNNIAFTGQSYDDGSSFLVGNIGKLLLGANCTIADDALDESFMPFPFDLEGLPKRRVALIEGGGARTPAVDKAYADRLGLPPTATACSARGSDHGVSLHTSIAGGTATREELIASTDRKSTRLNS